MIQVSRSKSNPKPSRVAFQPSDLYKIRICRASSGEQIPLLVGAETGLPLVRPNQFILVNRRDQCQVATLKGDLGVLSVVLSWAYHYGLNLDELCDRGSGLDQAAVASLIDALRANYRRRKTPSKVVAMTRPLVSTAAWANRIAIARDYVAWNLANALSKCDPGTLRYQHLRERRAISESLDRTRMSLEAARDEDETATIGVANWVARHERLEIDLITMLAVDEDERTADGELVRVFPDNPKKAEDSNAS